MTYDLSLSNRKCITFKSMPTPILLKTKQRVAPSSHLPKITLSPILPVNVFVPSIASLRSQSQSQQLQRRHHNVINLECEQKNRCGCCCGCCCCCKKNKTVCKSWLHSFFLIAMIAILLIIVATIIGKSFTIN
jgi:hypothetical protein